MKLLSQLILQSAIFVLFIDESFCAPHFNGNKRIKHQISVETEECPTANLEGLLIPTEELSEELSETPTEKLVQEFNNLRDQLTNSVESTQLNQTILMQVKGVWQSLVDSNSSELGDNTVKELRKNMAQILFIAQERFCESPDETFFNGQCLPIGSTEHCPSDNMELVDGSDNNGFCDCLDIEGENSLSIIFSDRTGQCYSQNTRGPCNVGEWFVLKDIPRCESIPDECPDDGRHVYGNVKANFTLDSSEEEDYCWEIGTTCPDEVSVVKARIDDDGNLYVYCQYDWTLRRKQIEDLVQDFKYLQAHFTNSMESNQPHQTILIQVKAVWQLLGGSSNLADGLNGDASTYVENLTQLDLKKDMAKILFVARERFCESPDETFFNGQCLPIGSTEHCPADNTKLVDGPDNNGFCDCYDTGENKLRKIFSNQTAQCYAQNTQGPCVVGEWFVLLGGIPRCESIPNGCPDDGRHVYGNIKANFTSDPSTEADCWKIGQKCPDEVSVVGVQQDKDGNLDVYCESPYSTVTIASSFYVTLAKDEKCRNGTRRSRSKNCVGGFFG